jgi:hypothetical protein
MLFRKAFALGVLVVSLALIQVAPSGAAPLPDNCTKEQGTVTCTTFEGPGNNQGGVGETTNTETQGNTTNKSPEESQDLQDTQSCNPPSSQGRPCNP